MWLMLECRSKDINELFLIKITYIGVEKFSSFFLWILEIIKISDNRPPEYFSNNEATNIRCMRLESDEEDETIPVFYIG